MALTKVGGGIIQQPIDVGIITATSVNASGVITATSFDGNVTGDVTGNVTGNLTGNVTGNVTGNADTASNLTGTPDVTVGSVTATTGNFSGNLDVGGVLTYEDVTNIDSIGIITARDKIKLTSADGQIEATGATGLSINASGASAFARFYTANIERLRINSNGVFDFKDNSFTNVGSIALDFIKGDADDNTNISFAGNDTITFKAGSTSPALTINTTQVKVEDNQKFVAGTGNDLDMYHDGTDTYIRNSTGQLLIRGNDIKLNNYLGTQTHAEFTDGGLTTGAIDLSAIDSTISDTAVDVFIYDTSKDSDGGDWRKRTQHTSWYNETLNTSTRGSRREFPAVAVIVAENDTLTIYDGDDPDLPMWMVFNAGNANGNNMIGRTNENTTCTSMLNGLLCVGREHFGFHMINFIADRARFKENGYDTPYTLPIGTNRNGGNTWLGANVGGNGLVNDLINDVAMTVLPNSPIDDATGLPVPTIAVGTDGGASIIKDDGSVVDITITTGTNYDVEHIDFTDDNRVVILWNAGGGEITIDEIPGADTSANYPINLPGSYYNDHSPTSYSPCFLTEGPSLSNRIPTAIQNFRAVGTTAALSVFEENKESEEDGMVAFISSSYNTGYQQGRIRGAFLSDTDDTNITGTDIIDNGDFGSNFTNWSIGGDTTPTISSGGAKLSTAAAIDGYVWQSTSGEAVDGKWVITWTLTANTSGFVGLVINGTQPANGNSYSSGGTLIKDGITASGSHYYDGTITAVEFRHRGGGGGHAIIDNITLKRVEEDRSVNNKGLQVFGTVTKSAVATGAELVSYGPFSTSNRLRQPYNSDLNFGTNDFSIIFWMYNTGSTIHQTLVGRDNREFSVDILDNANYDRKFRIYALDNGNSLQTFDSNADPFPLNTWSHVCVNYINGDTVAVYVNGVLNKSGSLNYDIDDTSNGLNIGCRNTGGTYAHAADATKLALVRISKSAPSEEQIKKMYEDEKVLFPENAKATLYGSSDAVTALAYDDDTDLLHVGTSSGRSDFQGLRRINNTTTAVTTAITAQNEFIIEQ